MSAPIIPGSESVSIQEGIRGGVLLLHGYSATPQSLGDWMTAFARAGFAVEAPLLPGHGTSVDEMTGTQWSDYVRAADVSYRKLAERHQRIFVGGLCLGGSIAAWLALLHPETTAGLMIINGPFKSPRGGNPDLLLGLLKTGKQFFTWSTPPVYVEDPQAPAVIAYDKVPIGPMPSIGYAWDELRQRLGEIHCPVLVFTSRFDTSVSPDDSITWLKGVSGPGEHVLLDKSNHVATLDYDKGIIEARSVEFALAITEGTYEQTHEDAA